MARGESRGGGYDAYINQQSEKRKALGTATRDNLASSSQTASPGSSPEAPASLGDLMTPSAPGRAAQPSSPEDFQNRVAENQSYLESPETKGMILQFATAMLGGSNPMHALGLALQMPGRMELAKNKRLNQEDIIAAREERLQMAQDRLGMAQDKFDTEQGKQKAREEIFGALGDMSDENLMKAATELASKGDLQGAQTALSLRKAANPDVTGVLAQFEYAKANGYKGDLFQFHQDMATTSVLEQIRAKKAAGQPLTPSEQQVYNDSISSNPFYAILAAAAASANQGQGGGATPAPSTSPAAPASTSTGMSGNVPFKVVTPKG